MEVSFSERELRDRYLQAMLEATAPLPVGAPDQERALQALIRATEMLKERFEQELSELRVEAAE